MAFTYNPLWKFLIDKGLSKNDLHKITKLSKSTIAKLARCENVNTNVLDRICDALNCKIEDVVEFTKEDN